MLAKSLRGGLHKHSWQMLDLDETIVPWTRLVNGVEMVERAWE